MTTTRDKRVPIELFAEGQYIGNGFLHRFGIECAAPLGDDVYDAICEAIEDGAGSIDIENVTYSWTIGE